jgi:hypothetical protein
MRKDPEPGKERCTHQMQIQSPFPSLGWVWAPYYGGLGWQHLYFEQGIQHVLIIIKHLRTPGHFQSLLQINLRWYTLIFGVSFAPFEFPGIPLPHLDGTWLNSTRRFLAHSRAQLLIPSTPQPKLFREHDHLIMDMVIRLDYPASQIRQINLCRLYLQASRLSEITILEGTVIHPGAWTSAECLASHHDWPRQRCPGPKTWALWQRMLTQAFCQPPLG